MPGSIFKSRPKSDRRLEWKTLKTSHARLLETNKLKVEIGLGKALDDMQKQVDKVVMLPADKLTPAALAPVVNKSAQVVKKHVTTLEPKLKNLDKMNKFILALKADVAWWEKAAKELNSQPVYLDHWDKQELEDILNGVTRAKFFMDKLDTLLQPALKRTALYDPPDEVEKWAAVSKALNPALDKLEILTKNKTANVKLIVDVLKQMDDDLRELRLRAVTINRLDHKELQPVTDWGAVKRASSDASNYLDEPVNLIGNLR